MLDQNRDFAAQTTVETTIALLVVKLVSAIVVTGASAEHHWTQLNSTRIGEWRKT